MDIMLFAFVFVGLEFLLDNVNSCRSTSDVGDPAAAWLKVPTVPDEDEDEEVDTVALA